MNMNKRLISHVVVVVVVLLGNPFVREREERKKTNTVEPFFKPFSYNVHDTLDL